MFQRYSLRSCQEVGAFRPKAMSPNPASGAAWLVEISSPRAPVFVLAFPTLVDPKPRTPRRSPRAGPARG